MYNRQGSMIAVFETIPISTPISIPVSIPILNGTKIRATSLVLSTTDCDEPCSITVTVIWKNTGNSGSFKPAITVNGIKTEKTYYITLGKNKTTTQIFNLTDLMEGTYTVCPYPN